MARGTVLMALLTVVAPTGAASAETGPAAGALTAVDIANRVDAHYNRIPRLTATFRQEHRDVTFGRTERSAGRVYLEKPGNMRWDYYSRRKSRASYVSDGRTMWAVDHANRQFASQPASQVALPAAATFLLGRGNLAADFRVALARGSGYGARGDHVLELRPRQPSAGYARLWLVVDPTDFRVKESIVEDATGNRNRFVFSDADSRTAIRASWFRVDAGALRRQGYSRVRAPRGRP